MLDVGEFQLTFFFNGTALPFGAACTLAAKNDAAIGPETILTTVIALVGSNELMQHSSSDVEFTSLLVKAGPIETGGSATAPAGIQGGDSDASASPNTTYLIRKQTGLGGRKMRGRMFWPGVPQAKLNADGTILAPTLATIVTNWGGFFTDMEDTLLPLALSHGDSTPTTLLSGLVPDGRAATQRRRLRR